MYKHQTTGIKEMNITLIDEDGCGERMNENHAARKSAESEVYRAAGRSPVQNRTAYIAQARNTEQIDGSRRASDTRIKPGCNWTRRAFE